MKRRITKLNGKQVMVEGLMTYGLSDLGLRTLDFQCCEDVDAEPFKGEFKVQGMRDGNVYMEEMKRRVRNKPMFREDNSSLSLGNDHHFYYVMRLDEALLDELPLRLVSQAKAIARKVIRKYELDVPFEICD